MIIYEWSTHADQSAQIIMKIDGRNDTPWDNISKEETIPIKGGRHYGHNY